MSQLARMPWEFWGYRYGGNEAWAVPGLIVIYIRRGFVLGAEREGKP